MDATLLPVLARWAQDVATQDGPVPALPAEMRRVEGVAATAQEALQRARQAFPGQDVLLLRADAELPSDALRCLMAAWSVDTPGDPAWDVLSPIDGRWHLFPEYTNGRQRQMLAWIHGEHAAFAHGEWSPVCSLWRGSALGDGPSPVPDEPRAALLPCLYVGPAQDPRGDELPLPLAVLQARMAGLALPDERATDRPVVLHVLHDWGGGIERFVRDLAAGDGEREHLLLVARGDEHRAPFGRRLCLHRDLDQPPLRTWTLSNPVELTDANSPEVAAVLAEVTSAWGVGAIIVSSLIGHSLDVLRTGLPTAVCVHDAYPVWPLLHDPRDPAQADFDLPALARGLKEAGPGFLLAGRSAEDWWALRQRYLADLAQADALMVAPSETAQRRIRGIAPALAERRWSLVPHGLAPFPVVRPGRVPRTGQKLRVLVPGRIQGAKGEHLLTAMLKDLPGSIELVLLGTGHRGSRFEGKANVTVHRDYDRDELPSWLARLAPDVALLPATVPETFSYTLSEMRALGLPVLCASPGAPAERVQRDGGGWVVAPEAATVNAKLAWLAGNRDELATIRADASHPEPTLADMAQAWRDALPTVATPLRLPPASVARVGWVAQQLSGVRLVSRLARGDAELAEATRELARRAEWAHDLQRQLDALPLRAAKAEDQTEIDRLEEYIRELDQQLADAHGFYQRDSNDLAHQRDVAVKQRDEANAVLKDVLSNPFWRMTGPPRRIARAIRNQALAGVYHVLHLRSLASRGIASLRSRGVAGTIRRLRERQAMRAELARLQPPPVVEQADSALRMPRAKSPRASIIVPVHNQLHYTLACLRALADSGDHSSIEVIVVDDASTDASPRVLPSIPGLRYHRNPQNLGFIGACNVGAELAVGEYVVFLNNDTTVQPGWLDALLGTFARYPDTGLAGSKLVYPDGRLQEAGGIVFADGSGWNYGRFADPAHPRYNFVREVDYCSGAAIALSRELFLQMQGFDDHYAPAYYEDTDLAMRIRARGLKVRYQPASVVIHHEGISSGTDLTRGVKAYQVTNHRKFVERWRDVLAANHAPPGSDPELASERDRRHHVLLLDACTPTPDRDSGSLRMAALMRVLREEGCAVKFFAENRAHDGAYTEAIQQLGVEAWWHPHLGDIPGWMAKNGRRFDLVIVSRHYVLSPLVPLIHTHARRAHLVFDTVDLHHVRELREAEISGDAAQLRLAGRTRKTELGLIAQCDSTWVVSDAEKAMLAQVLPKARVEVVSNIHEVHGPGLAFDERSGLLFVGSYRHPPNVDAVLWLAREIFPRIHAQRPEIELHLVGGDAPESVLALGDLPGVTFHGYVPDLLPLLVGSRVGIAPLRYGAGVKGKVNQSLAHGLPMVATLCAVEGMHLVDGEDVLVADAADAFAEAVLRLHDDRVLWQSLSQGGLENTRRHFSTEAVRTTLAPLLASLPRR